MKAYLSEVVNTKHWIPTGRFVRNKKTGKLKEVKRPVVHRRIFLTGNGNSPVGLVTNMRLVRIARHGEVTYSLAGRKETVRPWWEKNADGTPLPPIMADKYTKIGQSMNRLEAIIFLSAHIDNAGIVLDDMDNGEPMDGEESQAILVGRYGYTEYEWVDAKAA